MAVARPGWDEDSRQLRRNLAMLGASIQADAENRVPLAVATAKVWHAVIMTKLAVDDAVFVGRFRGEPGLERCGVEVDGKPGTMPWDVAAELAGFERRLLQVVANLDRRYPDAESLDLDGMSAVIELAGWAHAEWVRIHPFANGNGRTARVWANLLLMRYGLPPVVTLRPRPGGSYGAAGAAAMGGDWAPTVELVHEMLKGVVPVAGSAKPKR